MPLDDPYRTLRPTAPTLEEELCGCPSGGELVLCAVLTPNPIQCAACGAEVPPERLGFDAQLAEGIAFWRTVFEALYNLWLHSGEYEEWAAARLADPNGQVNVVGRELAEKLSAIAPTWYWCFADEEAEPPAACPICSGELEPWEERSVRKCVACRIVV